MRNHSSLFSFLSHYHTLREDLYSNTTHTYLECRVCFRAWEALGIYQKKLVRLGGCNWAYCGIWKVRQDTVSRSLVGVVENLGTLGKLGLKGFFLFFYPNLLSSGSIYRLEGGKEFFHRVLRFFSSITRLDVILDRKSVV